MVTKRIPDFSLDKVESGRFNEKIMRQNHCDNLFSFFGYWWWPTE